MHLFVKMKKMKISALSLANYTPPTHFGKIKRPIWACLISENIFFTYLQVCSFMKEYC